MSNLFVQIERLQQLHILIKNKKTGTPEELSKQFNISKRQLYNLQDELKDYGADIKYSRLYQTFYYGNTFEFKLELYIKAINKDEIQEISGGTLNISFRASLFHGNTLILYL